MRPLAEQITHNKLRCALNMLISPAWAAAKHQLVPAAGTGLFYPMLKKHICDSSEGVMTMLSVT